MAPDELKASVKQAVAEGIHAALQDKTVTDAFWAGAFDALQTRAQQASGKFVLGWIGASVKRLAMVVAIGMLVYSLGGWTALAAFWKSFGASQ